MGDHECFMEDRIRQLETGQTETRVYVKQIKEDIHEIKSSIKELQTPLSTKKSDLNLWQPVVIELIKLLGTCIAILGAIVGAIKIIGD